MSEWRIVAMNPNYEVSDDGRVRQTGGRELTQTYYSRYFSVSLRRPKKLVRVHRLVALAFVPNPNAYPVINHIDHDRLNNSASNLEWCTQAMNISHARDAGRLHPAFVKGNRFRAKLTDAQAAEAFLLRSSRVPHRVIAEKLGVSTSVIKRLPKIYGHLAPPREVGA